MQVARHGVTGERKRCQRADENSKWRPALNQFGERQGGPIERARPVRLPASNRNTGIGSEQADVSHSVKEAECGSLRDALQIKRRRDSVYEPLRADAALRATTHLAAYLAAHPSTPLNPPEASRVNHPVPE